MDLKYKLTDKVSQDVIDVLFKIHKQQGLTPENILKEAEKEDNPLHNIFEWDDSVAGVKWRLQQARILVNEVKVYIGEQEYYAFENVNTPIVLSIGSDKENVSSQRAYMPIVEILSNEDMKKQVIMSALNHLAYWEKQYSKYEELAPIIKVSQKIREKLTKKWKKKEQ